MVGAGWLRQRRAMWAGLSAAGSRVAAGGPGPTGTQSRRGRQGMCRSARLNRRLGGLVSGSLHATLLHPPGRALQDPNELARGEEATALAVNLRAPGERLGGGGAAG